MRPRRPPPAWLPVLATLALVPTSRAADAPARRQVAVLVPAHSHDGGATLAARLVLETRAAGHEVSTHALAADVDPALAAVKRLLATPAPHAAFCVLTDPPRVQLWMLDARNSRPRGWLVGASATADAAPATGDDGDTAALVALRAVESLHALVAGRTITADALPAPVAKPAAVRITTPAPPTSTPTPGLAISAEAGLAVRVDPGLPGQMLAPRVRVGVAHARGPGLAMTLLGPGSKATLRRARGEAEVAQLRLGLEGVFETRPWRWLQLGAAAGVGLERVSVAGRASPGLLAAAAALWAWDASLALRLGWPVNDWLAVGVTFEVQRGLDRIRVRIAGEDAADLSGTTWLAALAARTRL